MRCPVCVNKGRGPLPSQLRQYQWPLGHGCSTYDTAPLLAVMGRRKQQETDELNHKKTLLSTSAFMERRKYIGRLGYLLRFSTKLLCKDDWILWALPSWYHAKPFAIHPLLTLFVQALDQKNTVSMNNSTFSRHFYNNMLYIITGDAMQMLCFKSKL